MSMPREENTSTFKQHRCEEHELMEMLQKKTLTPPPMTQLQKPPDQSTPEQITPEQNTPDLTVETLKPRIECLKTIMGNLKSMLKDT